ncbi:MAG: acyl carrier protein [Ruminococcaceae bacterium]|nr:acyl carrier protein [Oscillospiraceae bacterium]
MYDKVVEIIARQLQIDTDVMDENTKIMEDLGADSLDVVEMLMAMEEAFGFAVPDEDIEELVTVSDIVAYVESNMEA